MSFIDRYERQLVQAAARRGAPSRSRVARRWRMLAAAAAVLAIGGAAFLLLQVRDGAVRRTPAAAALERLGSVAAARADTPPQQRVSYSRVQELTAGFVPAIHEFPHLVVQAAQTQELWVGPNGERRQRTGRGRIIRAFGTPAAVRRWRAAGSPSFSLRPYDLRAGPKPTGRRRVPPAATKEGAAPRALAAPKPLPSDPRELLRIFRRISRVEKASADPASHSYVLHASVDQITVNNLASQLLAPDLAGPPGGPSRGSLEPEVRAGLFRALALVPGVQVLPSVTDPLGRRGVAVVTRSAADLNPVGKPGFGVPVDNESRLIFDPRTSAVLASETVATASAPRASVERGALLSAFTFVTRAPVDSLDDAPPGGARSHGRTAVRRS